MTAQRVPIVRLYAVSVRWADGKDVVSTVSARSRGAARMDVWRGDVYGHMPFPDFRRISTVRVLSKPLAIDGYEYVRRYYEVEVRTGQRVTVRDCGGSLDGKLGTVVYPGSSTAHVHILFDHYRHSVQAHPFDVLPAPLDLPAAAGLQVAA